MASIVHDYADIAARLQHSDVFHKPPEQQAPAVQKVDPDAHPICPTCGNPDRKNYLLRNKLQKWGCRGCNKWI
jgi:hypothetical protein